MLESEFQVGDAVYHESGNGIGIITDVRKIGEAWNYRVDYCQGKDIEGPRGGNGPIFKEGFPKPVTEASDILFVHALKLNLRIKAQKRELAKAEADLLALIRAKALITASIPD